MKIREQSTEVLLKSLFGVPCRGHLIAPLSAGPGQHMHDGHHMGGQMQHNGQQHHQQRQQNYMNFGQQQQQQSRGVRRLGSALLILLAGSHKLNSIDFLGHVS